MPSYRPKSLRRGPSARGRASVSLPPGPSKTYRFSTLTQGSSRRCQLNSSRSRVNSFSLLKCCLRATSYSSRDTMRLCFFLLSSRLSCRVDDLGARLGTKHLHSDSRQSARRHCSGDHQRSGGQARWTHGFLLSWHSRTERPEIERLRPLRQDGRLLPRAPVLLDFEEGTQPAMEGGGSTGNQCGLKDFK
jgi:hypothetical protein